MTARLWVVAGVLLVVAAVVVVMWLARVVDVILDAREDAAE